MSYFYISVYSAWNIQEQICGSLEYAAVAEITWSYALNIQGAVKC